MHKNPNFKANHVDDRLYQDGQQGQIDIGFKMNKNEL